METKVPQSVGPQLSFLEAESPATTGIAAAVIARQPNAHSHMSVITVGVVELTDDQTIGSQCLNQDLSGGQKLGGILWDPAAAVRSRTVCWTPASAFDKVELSLRYHS